MSKKNCPNCGAPIEYEHDKCQYCGTIYYDLSEVNFDNDYPAPIFFRIKTNRFSRDEKPATVLIKAIPRLNELDFTYDYADAAGVSGSLCRFYTGSRCSMNMQFEAIEQDDHSLVKIIKDDWLR